MNYGTSSVIHDAADMTLTPHPYQLKGIEFLAARTHALLADDMGLGKSAQAILAAKQIGARRILVICPAVARFNWVNEFNLWWPEREDAELFVYSYNGAAEALASRFDLLICDESHFLKSIDAKRAKVILGKNGILHNVKRAWFLTGTPAPNHYGELWILLYTLGRTTLTYQAFVERYCNTINRGFSDKPSIVGSKTLPHLVAELKAALEPIMLRRMKSEVLTELPPITFSELVVPAVEPDFEATSSLISWKFPEDKTAQYYSELEREAKTVSALLNLSGHNGPPSEASMAALQAIAKSVSTLRKHHGLQKVHAACEILDEELSAKAYKKVVVFAIHRDVIEQIRTEMVKRGYGVVTLYGKTPPNQVVKNIEKFQRNDLGTQIFIGNITACGTAINLTAAHHVIFVEQDWVPGNNAQAAMRCHRIGQKMPVSVRVLSVPDSVDSVVTRRLMLKSNQLAQIFDEKELTPKPTPFTAEDIENESTEEPQDL